MALGRGRAKEEEGCVGRGIRRRNSGRKGKTPCHRRSEPRSSDSLAGVGVGRANALRDLEQESPLCGPRFLCLGRGMEPAGVAPCLRRLRILVLGITKGKHLKLWL